MGIWTLRFGGEWAEMFFSDQQLAIIIHECFPT
jgi:hypothetical protein